MISLILPIYNVEKYIGACINSIIKQDYRDYEVILVDDGSPDNSASIAESLLKEERNINYRVIHTENKGVSAARNTGIRDAKGDYLIMIDSDDIIAPGFLSTYINLIENNPNCNIYSTGFKILLEEKNKEIDCLSDRDIDSFSPEVAQEKFFARKITFLLPTMLFKRDFLMRNHIYFDESVRYSEDVQFIWRCLCYNDSQVFHQNTANYLYILHPGSTMTASNVKKISTGFDGIQRLYPELKCRLTSNIVNDFYNLYCFNLAHGAARLLKYRDFLEMIKKYNLKSHFKELSRCSSIIDRRIILVSRITVILPFIGYGILRKF